MSDSKGLSNESRPFFEKFIFSIDIYLDTTEVFIISNALQLL